MNIDFHYIQKMLYLTCFSRFLVFVSYCNLITYSLVIHTTNSHSLGTSALKLRFNNGLNKKDPLLLRTARGEEIERVPVWMMRQAGRHMKVLFSHCNRVDF